MANELKLLDAEVLSVEQSTIIDPVSAEEKHHEQWLRNWEVKKNEAIEQERAATQEKKDKKVLSLVKDLRARVAYILYRK